MTDLVAQYIMDHTAQECIKRFSRNNSFIANLGQVFSHLSSNIQLLFKCDNVAHVFVNRTQSEIDVISSFKDTSENSRSKPEYKRFRFEDSEAFELLLQISGIKDRTQEDIDIPKFKKLNSTNFSKLIDLIRITKTNKDLTALIIPFDISYFNLGFFLLWGKRTKSDDSIDEDRLRGWVASIYHFLKEFLMREYFIVDDSSYLPSLYASRWKPVAILFADIMNFTPLTERLKARYGQPGSTEAKVFQNILNQHCDEMAKIIQDDGQGRIENFFGTRVMAVFGEHEENASKAACNAVYTATLVIEKFKELKTIFLNKAFGKGYEIEYNESVDINLRVGVDFGTVLFDYLGNDDHREYTAIGDHVKFAEFLEHKALRSNEKGPQNPPILLSHTVERCTRPWIEPKDKISLQLIDSEKGCIYQVYGINSDGFSRDYFLKCRKSNSWKNAWKTEDAPFP
jgi:class 3 adenylate cyclase